MTTENLYQAFEESLNAGSLCGVYCLDKGEHGYLDPLAQGIWELWAKSRSDIAVHLPNSYDYLLGISERHGYKKAISECQVRLEALGFTVLTLPETDLGKSILADNNN